MTDNIFILTEGAHDAAFIYKILLANGVKSHNIAIKNYPSVLKNLFMENISSVPVEEIKVDDATPKFFPHYVAKNNDSYFCIYATNGLTQNKVRDDFIKTIKSFVVSDPDEIAVGEDGDIYSILFFVDADDEGVDIRMGQIKSDLKLSFAPDSVDGIGHKEIRLIDGINIGIFVITGSDKNTGMLEDILIPLMKKDNEGIFNSVEKFLSDNTENADANRYENYKYKKAVIGTAGQLQISGCSNAVYIKKTDYMTNDKIKSDEVCNEIFSFIKQAMTC